MIYGRCKFLKDWNDWDKDIHNEKDQIKRQGYAITYPFTFKIDKENQTGRFSSTSFLPYYDTTLTNCTCDDFQYRKLPCKHIYRLAEELGLIEIVNRTSSEYVREKLDLIKQEDNIHDDPEQLKRIEKARSSKMKILSIDKENQSAVFAGSGKTPYETTLISCTCRDFTVRKLPCKHMYRLAMECGVFPWEK